MNIEGLNRWLGLGANIGIVVGLIMVWFQLEQGERLAMVSQTNFEYESQYTLMDLSLGEELPNAWARARLNVTDMSIEELALVNAYLDRAFFTQLVDKKQEKRNVTETDLKFVAGLFVVQYLDNEVALRWWENSNRDGGLTRQWPEFTDAVNAIVESMGSDLRTREERRIKVLKEGPLPKGVK